MKFKVIEYKDDKETNEDKNIYWSWDWVRLKRRVAENPKRMTFNPLEVEFQKLREYWLRERRDRMIQKLLLVIMVGLILFVIYSGIMEVSI